MIATRSDDELAPRRTGESNLAHAIGSVTETIGDILAGAAVALAIAAGRD